MNTFECSIFAFVHTSQEVVKTLTTHLHLLGPKSNYVVKFVRETQRTGIHEVTKANGDLTEVDASKLSNSEDTERSNLQEQLLAPRSPSDSKDAENTRQNSNHLPKKPVDPEQLVSSVSLQSFIACRSLHLHRAYIFRLFPAPPIIRRIY